MLFSFLLMFGLIEVHKTVFVLRDLGGINIDRLAHGCDCKPFGVVVPKRAEYWVARDFMETDDLGENAVVANRLVQMKLVCHVDVLLIVCFPLR